MRRLVVLAGSATALAAACSVGGGNIEPGGAGVAPGRDGGAPTGGQNATTGGTGDIGGSASTGSGPSPGHFVTRQGMQLMRDGAPYRFVGVNVYALAGGPLATSCQLSADADGFAQKRDATLDALARMGVGVVRLWAFQNVAGPSGTDLSALDGVVDAAKRRGMGVILTLENAWSDCTLPADPKKKPPSWYQSEYTGRYGYPLSLPDYIYTVVKHFKDEPAVIMWQIMNEAESADPAALQSFASALAAEIKAIDGNHLVNLGTLGCGQAGTVGDDYRRLYANPNIDVVEAHDYDHDNEMLPACIQQDLAVARELEKPFFVGEVGIDISRGMSRSERAVLIRGKMQRAVEEGYAGFLVWQYNAQDSAYGFDEADGDPLPTIIKDMSAVLR